MGERQIGEMELTVVREERRWRARALARARAPSGRRYHSRLGCAAETLSPLRRASRANAGRSIERSAHTPPNNICCDTTRGYHDARNTEVRCARVPLSRRSANALGPILFLPLGTCRPVVA